MARTPYVVVSDKAGHRVKAGTVVWVEGYVGTAPNLKIIASYDAHGADRCGVWFYRCDLVRGVKDSAEAKKWMKDQSDAWDAVRNAHSIGIPTPPPPVRPEVQEKANAIFRAFKTFQRDYDDAKLLKAITNCLND